MKNYFKFLEEKTIEIIIASFIVGALITLISTGFHKEKRALTTFGDYNEAQAVQMSLKTSWWYGWPVPISPPSLGLVPGETPASIIGDSIFANGFVLLIFFISFM